MINKNFMSLIHLNTEKKYVIVYTVNPHELTSSTVSEFTKQIFNFFQISIPAHLNIEIEIVNANIRDSDVNRMTCKSNHMLNLVLCMMHNDCFFQFQL